MEMSFVDQKNHFLDNNQKLKEFGNYICNHSLYCG